MIHPNRNKHHLKSKSQLFFRAKIGDQIKKSRLLSGNFVLRKHFWKLLLLDLVLWMAFIGTIFFVSPEGQFGVEIFFALLSIAILIFAYLITGHKRRSVLITTALVGLILLRFYKLDEWFNLAMLLGLLISVEMLFVVE